MQRGTTAVLKLHGKPGTLPISAWCDRAGFEAQISESGEDLTLTIPTDAAPGVAFLRIYNAEGATSLLPILLGVLPEMQEVEPNNSVAQATQVELPHSVFGVLHKSNEVDTFAMRLHAGDRLTASIESRRVYGSPMDGVLQILDPVGNVLLQNDDHHDIDPQLEWTAPADGVYFARVFAFPAEPDSSIRFAGGDDYIYRLTLTAGPFLNYLQPGQEADAAALPGLHHGLPPISLAEFQPAATTEQPAREPLPRMAWIGTVAQPGSASEVRVKFAKDVTYQLQVQAREIGSHLDPVLKILSPEGKELKEVDDANRKSLDIETSWKAPDDGEYRLAVTDRFGHGGADYFFHMIANRDEPRCTLSVDEDHFVLPADKPLEIPVNISRAGEFNQRLTITVENLPEGVALTGAVSEPEGDSAKKVVLKLEAGTSMPFNGPIRIVARSEATPPLEIVGTAKTKAESFRVSTLWLTR